MSTPSPSERELEILKVLWRIGPASVREVHKDMCPRDELAFNTVQTTLRIMDDKGLASHKREGRTFIYTATYSRERELSRFLEKVFDGAVDQVVLGMLSANDVSHEELRSIEGMIADARKSKKKAKRG